MKNGNKVIKYAQHNTSPPSESNPVLNHQAVLLTPVCPSQRVAYENRAPEFHICEPCNMAMQHIHVQVPSLTEMGF